MWLTIFALFVLAVFYVAYYIERETSRVLDLTRHLVDNKQDR